MAQNDVVKSCNDLILHYNDGLISCNNVLSLCDDMIQQLNDVLCSWDDVLPPHKDVKKLGNDVQRSYNDVLSPYNDLHLPQNDVSSGGKGRDPRLKQLPNDILFLLINLLQNRRRNPVGIPSSSNSIKYRVFSGRMPGREQSSRKRIQA